MSDLDEESFDDLMDEKEEVEDEDELSGAEEGFLKGYEEEMEDPEAIADEEEL